MYDFYRIFIHRKIKIIEFYAKSLCPFLRVNSYKLPSPQYDFGTIITNFVIIQNQSSFSFNFSVFFKSNQSL
jgi:hypothetical protein